MQLCYIWPGDFSIDFQTLVARFNRGVTRVTSCKFATTSRMARRWNVFGWVHLSLLNTLDVQTVKITSDVNRQYRANRVLYYITRIKFKNPPRLLHPYCQCNHGKRAYLSLDHQTPTLKLSVIEPILSRIGPIEAYTLLSLTFLFSVDYSPTLGRVLEILIEYIYKKSTVFFEKCWVGLCRQRTAFRQRYSV